MLEDLHWDLAAVPETLRYAREINAACNLGGGQIFAPKVAYAIASQESIAGELSGEWNACTVVSSDGGHGLFQLTSSFPPNWEDPSANAAFAVDCFLVPALRFWRACAPSIIGYGLVRCVAAAYNAGPVAAFRAHLRGNVDACTTDNYADRALAGYLQLCT